MNIYDKQKEYAKKHYQLNREAYIERGKCWNSRNKEHKKEYDKKYRSRRWSIKIWHGIMDRCYNEKSKFFYRYGGRGILVCEEWQDPERFSTWASVSGYSEGLTIERIDNDGQYSPSNCRWATRKEQARNRRTSKLIFYRGETKSLAQWVDDLSLNYARVFARINKLGWDTERAFGLRA